MNFHTANTNSNIMQDVKMWVAGNGLVFGAIIFSLARAAVSAVIRTLARVWRKL